MGKLTLTGGKVEARNASDQQMFFHFLRCSYVIAVKDRKARHPCGPSSCETDCASTPQFRPDRRSQSSARNRVVSADLH